MENQIIKVDNLVIGGHYSNTKVEVLNAHDLNDNTVVRTIYLDLNYRGLWLIKRTAI